MKANANPIVLKSNRTSDECIGTVRLTPEAEKVIRRLRAKTALPIRQIVSEIIVQAEKLKEMTTTEKTYNPVYDKVIEVIKARVAQL